MLRVISRHRTPFTVAQPPAARSAHRLASDPRPRTRHGRSLGVRQNEFRSRRRQRHVAGAAARSSSRGTSIAKRPGWRMRPATCAGFLARRRNRDRRAPVPTMAEPVSCPTIRRRNCVCRLRAVDRQFGLDVERRAVNMQRPVHRDRASGRERHALRAFRLFGRRERSFAEENIRFVLARGFPSRRRDSPPSICGCGPWTSLRAEWRRFRSAKRPTGE